MLVARKATVELTRVIVEQAAGGMLALFLLSAVESGVGRLSVIHIPTAAFDTWKSVNPTVSH